MLFWKKGVSRSWRSLRLIDRRKEKRTAAGLKESRTAIRLGHAARPARRAGRASKSVGDRALHGSEEEVRRPLHPSKILYFQVGRRTALRRQKWAEGGAESLQRSSAHGHGSRVEKRTERGGSERRTGRGKKRRRRPRRGRTGEMPCAEVQLVALKQSPSVTLVARGNKNPRQRRNIGESSPVQG